MDQRDEEVHKLVLRLHRLIQEIRKTPAYIEPSGSGRNRRNHWTLATIHKAAKYLKSITPARPCPACGGEPPPEDQPCLACANKGYQTTEEVAQANGTSTGGMGTQRQRHVANRTFTAN